MADGHIAVTEGAGKNLQTFENTISTVDVHAEAVTLVDTAGAAIASLPVTGPITDAQLRASAVPVSIATSIPTNEVPDATSTFAPSNASSSAYESNRVIKGSAGVLFAITGFNSSATDQFIQIHDASSLPGDTAVPVITFFVRATRNFSLSFGGKFGRFFTTGIVICNSSTGPTKTIGAANCWFDAQFK